MASLATVLTVLDLLSAALTLVIALGFARLWTRSRRALHLLFALGMGLVGASFIVVGPSAFDIGEAPDLWDHLRLAGQTGGVLTILAAYWSSRATGQANPRTAIGFVLATMTILYALLYFVVPPAFTLPTRQMDFVVAHSIMAIAWAGCAYLALRRGGPPYTTERLLVPGAFLAFAVSKYSWLIIDIADDPGLAPLVYPWRFMGIFLMLLAFVLPPREAPNGPT
ncbi:MAG TPA: hypothetical protein VM370_09450 [Candidatus Thermoplasmatota archaeon]|nr:hypothetical protein [Candidatus Thermoplasmatota archaeon]